MATIQPFRALRPDKDKVHLVATRPFYDYNKSLLEEELATNPYTFLHVILPDFPSCTESDAGSVSRYQRSRRKLDQFIAEGIFVKEKTASLYLYRQSTGGDSFLGIIAGASVSEYAAGRIKRHEATIAKREKQFADYLEVVEYNAEPVLLFHREHAPLTELLEVLTQGRPEYKFSTSDGVEHEVWVIEECATIDQLRAHYRAITPVYIADGHHRCASSARWSAKSAAKKDSPSHYFLACFISEKSMKILDYNRLVSDLNGQTTEEFMAAVADFFEVERTVRSHRRVPHHILMYLEGDWYNLKAKAGTFAADDPVASLDTAVLTEHLLTPILGIRDLRTDARISFMSGTRGLEGIEKAVDSGQQRVGFVLHPVTAEQLKAVADQQRVMPPKSTWIVPKLRSGLTLYPLNDD